MTVVQFPRDYKEPPILVHQWPSAGGISFQEVQRRNLVDEAQKQAQALQNTLQQIVDTPDNDDWRKEAIAAMHDVVMGVNAGLCHQKDSIDE